MSLPILKVIIASTREQRVGESVAKWFVDFAARHGKFDVRTVDLREMKLPLLDEPNHPMRRQYVHDHTKAWSKTVAEADAFVFVIPEYNYSMPPALLNALDYLVHEWQYKAAGMVSYGGVSAGTRSSQMTRSVLATLKMVAIPEAVSIPFVAKQINDGVFDPGDTQDKAAAAMLDEIARWTTALRVLRAP